MSTCTFIDYIQKYGNIRDIIKYQGQYLYVENVKTVSQNMGGGYELQCWLVYKDQDGFKEYDPPNRNVNIHEMGRGNEVQIIERNYQLRKTTQKQEVAPVNKEVVTNNQTVNKNNNMNVTNLYKQLVDKNTLTLKKAGFLSEQLSITDEGMSELLGILFMQHKEALVKIAEEKLNDKKDSK